MGSADRRRRDPFAPAPRRRPAAGAQPQPPAVPAAAEPDTGPASAPTEVRSADTASLAAYLQNLRKADLIHLADERGLDSGGTKAELIERLTAAGL